MKVRLTTFARPDADLLNRFSSRYLQGGRTWKDITFVADDSYDRLIILTYPYGATLRKGYHEDKALTFMTEPSLSPYAKAHPTSRVMKFHLHLPFFPNRFSIDSGLSDLQQQVAIKKTDIISAIVSELSGLPGHRYRLELVHAMDQVFEEGLEIYGRPQTGSFFKLLTNYKGFLDDKYEGLWRFAYHLACENCFENGYFTEKIVDPIIAETLCFYDGCPDIENYIDPKAFIKIDVKNIETSIHTIAKSINDNEWKNRLPYICKEKKRFLTELHPFNMIWLAVHDKDLSILYTKQ